MKRTKVVIHASDGSRFEVAPEENPKSPWVVRRRRKCGELDECMRLEGYARAMGFQSLSSALSYVDTFFRGRSLVRRHFWRTDRKPIGKDLPTDGAPPPAGNGR